MKQIYYNIFALLVAFFTSTSVFAYDFEVDGICYNLLSEEEVEVTKKTGGYTGDIVIPESIQYENKKYMVIAIGPDAFGNTSRGVPNKPTSVTMPNSIKNIGNSAFRNCHSLTSIVIPNSVITIDDQAFRWCDGLTFVIIGGNVTTIGQRAFEGCNSLTNVTSLNPIPPTIFAITFNNFTATLQVPIGSLEAYQNAKVWKNFSNIVEVDFSFPIACYINALNFPDAKFREFLLNEQYGKDCVLTEEEIAGITSMDVSNQGISDLKGIEYFTALKKLLCYKNNLTELNLSANKLLTDVDCYSNQIMGIKMDSLLASLPTLKDKEGSLYVFDITDDGNICFTDQVAFANSKGWSVYYYTGSNWQKYAGREKGILIAEENFPDEYFRKYLMNQEYGKDMVISDEEIKTITSISVSGDYMDSNKRYITSLKGIEHFTSLTSLNCCYNKLTTLDVSNNKELTVLSCHHNGLKSLDISNNVLLTSLYCDCNGLTELDLSKNISLTTLSCHHNKLTYLDVSKNRALTSLACADDSLKNLDVSKNAELIYLYCPYNQLTSLDVSKNSKLTELACMGNMLTNLDVSKNLKLKFLKFQGNKINGEKMTQTVEGLPNQTSGTLCVSKDVCTKSHVKIANAKGWKVMIGYENFGSGPDAYYPHYEEYEGSDCDDIFVDEEHFPDSIFRDYLLGQEYVHYGVIFRNTVADISNINVTHKNITTLQGIEFFTSLKTLSCGQTRLTTLDVSKNTELTWLETYGTPLTSLNISGCTALQYLGSYWGQLTTLDVSECTSLETLVCKGNQLTSLDVSKNTALKSLNCEGNLLTSLNISGCTALRYLECFGNQLSMLNVSECTELTRLYCYQNQIKGNAMDSLIVSLPKSYYCEFQVILNNDKEGNVITTTQAAAAKEKGWTPLYSNDGLSWQEYLGSDQSIVHNITLDKDTNAPIYDLNGRKLKEPNKGINIINGKKIIIK